MKAGIYWDIENIPFRYQQLVRKYILNKGYEIGEHKYIGTSESNAYRFDGIRKKRGFKHVMGNDISSGADYALLSKVHYDIDEIDLIVIVSNDKIFQELKSLGKDMLVFYNYEPLEPPDDIEHIYVYNNFK